jgi:hypothetical protein
MTVRASSVIAGQDGEQRGQQPAHDQQTGGLHLARDIGADDEDAGTDPGAHDQGGGAGQAEAFYKAGFRFCAAAGSVSAIHCVRFAMEALSRVWAVYSKEQGRGALSRRTMTGPPNRRAVLGHDNLEKEGPKMNLEIHKPELLQRVNTHIKAGHFHDADELLEKPLDALDEQTTDAVPPTATGAVVLAALQARPYPDIDLTPSRVLLSNVRDVVL